MVARSVVKAPNVSINTASSNRRSGVVRAGKRVALPQPFWLGFGCGGRCVQKSNRGCCNAGAHKAGALVKPVMEGRAQEKGEASQQGGVQDMAMKIASSTAAAAIVMQPQTAEAALTPSLKNLLLSLVAGGVVLGLLVGAIAGVSRVDKVQRE